jgi:hypothetical protein
LVQYFIDGHLDILLFHSRVPIQFGSEDIVVTLCSLPFHFSAKSQRM